MNYLALALSLGVAAGSGGAQAQTPTPPSAPVAAPAPATALPAGTGPGVHSPNSPIAPLQARADVVPWSVLTTAKTKTVKKRILPVFPSDVLAMDKKTQRIQGFMMPLQMGEKQKHFILSSVPLTCAFCFPGGPESLVEVTTKTAIKYTMDTVVVEGTFSLMNDDPNGFFYSLTDAVPVK